MGYGRRVKREMQNHQFGKTPATTPAGILYLALNTASPGEDGQTSNEATGTGYARLLTAATDWGVATLADPSVLANLTALILTAAAGGTWSGGVDFTHFSLWTHLTNSTEAEFFGFGVLGTAKPVTSGDPAQFAIGALTMEID